MRTGSPLALSLVGTAIAALRGLAPPTRTASVFGLDLGGSASSVMGGLMAARVVSTGLDLRATRDLTRDDAAVTRTVTRAVSAWWGAQNADMAFYCVATEG